MILPALLRFSQMGSDAKFRVLSAWYWTENEAGARAAPRILSLSLLAIVSDSWGRRVQAKGVPRWLSRPICIL